MTIDAEHGRDPLGQALAVPVEPVARLDPSGFDPSREAVLVSLIYDDGEHEPHECSREAICLTPGDAHAFVAERYPEARRVGDDELAGYSIVVNGEELDVTAVLWRVPLWSAAIATEARRAETSSGSVHEGAGLQGIAQPQSVSGLSHTGGDQ